MGKKPETLFKETVLEALNQLPRTWACKIQQVAKRGTPDIIACINGVFVAIELKRGETVTVDPLQEWTLKKIVEADGIAAIAYPENWEAIYTYLKKIAQHFDNGQAEAPPGIKH